YCGHRVGLRPRHTAWHFFLLERAALEVCAAVTQAAADQHRRRLAGEWTGGHCRKVFPGGQTRGRRTHGPKPESLKKAACPGDLRLLLLAASSWPPASRLRARARGSNTGAAPVAMPRFSVMNMSKYS